MNDVRLETYIRTGLTGFALLNQVLTAFGKNPVPISEDELYEFLSAAVLIGATIWSWWKNNSFTKAAIEADNYKTKIKEEITNG